MLATRRSLLKALGLLSTGGLAPAHAAQARTPSQPAEPRWVAALPAAYVAGLPYYDVARVFESLTDEEVLLLRREPDNVHDRRAIEILTANGVKLGYVARRQNESVAALMDGGARLRALVQWKQGQHEALLARASDARGGQSARWLDVRYKVEVAAA